MMLFVSRVHGLDAKNNARGGQLPIYSEWVRLADVLQGAQTGPCLHPRLDCF